MKTFNKGFTLVEVLLVLAIIGVIASITTPVLITNINEHKNMTMLKKLYSSYTVNIKSMLNSEYATSCNTLSCLRKWNNAGVHNGALADTRYFNVRNECIGDCLTDYLDENTKFPTNSIKYPANKEAIDGGNETTATLNASLYILANGAATLVYDMGGNCTQTISSSDDGSVDFKYCSIIIFDTNGANGPNAPCSDRFAFYVANDATYGNSANNIQPNYLVPFGYNNLDNEGENNIYNCTAIIMSNGWKKKK